MGVWWSNFTWETVPDRRHSVRKRSLTSSFKSYRDFLIFCLYDDTIDRFSETAEWWAVRESSWFDFSLGVATFNILIILPPRWGISLPSHQPLVWQQGRCRLITITMWNSLNVFCARGAMTGKCCAWHKSLDRRTEEDHNLDLVSAGRRLLKWRRPFILPITV